MDVIHNLSRVRRSFLLRSETKRKQKIFACVQISFFFLAYFASNLGEIFKSKMKRKRNRSQTTKNMRREKEKKEKASLFFSLRRITGKQEVKTLFILLGRKTGKFEVKTFVIFSLGAKTEKGCKN